MRAAAIAIVLCGLAPAPLGAATVSVHSQTARDRSRTMVLTATVAASRADLWRALTTAQGWRRWAAPRAWQVGSNPRLIETSYDATAHPGDPQTIRQLFVQERAPREFAFRTVKAPRGFADFATYAKVENRVTLTRLGPRRTRIVFRAGPYPDNAAGRRLYAFFVAGNRKTLSNIADVLGAGQASRFGQAER